jgi:hypothetical protein
MGSVQALLGAGRGRDRGFPVPGPPREALARQARAEYHDHADINSTWTRPRTRHDLRAGVKPSEVQFSVDQEAYRDALANWKRRPIRR